MLEVKVIADTLTPELRRLIEQAGDLTPVMQEISAIMFNAVQDNFESDGRPAWEPLSPVTLARRRDQGNGAKILRDTGQLVASIEADYDSNSAVVGTNDPKAKTHQFGASQGQYGTTSRGGPIPWGDIPAREFLVLTEQDQADITRAWDDFLRPQ